MLLLPGFDKEADVIGENGSRRQCGNSNGVLPALAGRQSPLLWPPFVQKERNPKVVTTQAE